MGQMPNLMPHEFEQRMIEYIKLLQNPKDIGRSQSPDCLSRSDAASALEMSRLAIWSMYKNNTSPPPSINTTSPPNIEPQREALNLSESPTHSVKREREIDMDYGERDDHDFGMPALKKVTHSSLHPLPSHLQQTQHSSPHSHHYKHDHHRHSTTPPSPNVRNTSSDRGQSHHHNNNHHSSSSRRRMSTSPQRNGTSSSSLNGSSDPLTVGSPISLLSGMQFKLFSRGKYFFSNDISTFSIQIL